MKWEIQNIETRWLKFVVFNRSFVPSTTEKLSKRRFRPENITNVFCPRYIGLEILERYNHRSIAMSLFFKSFVIKIFFVHTKTDANAGVFKSLRFERRDTVPYYLQPLAHPLLPLNPTRRRDSIKIRLHTEMGDICGDK